MKPYASRLNQPQAMPVAQPSRTLPVFVPGVDDAAIAIFDRVLLHIRRTEPSVAHRPLHELELRYADLFGEIAEITDAL